MSLETIAQTLAETPLAYYLSDSPWLFGAVESVHVLALTLVFGSIAVVDLRLIGIGPAHGPAQQVIDRLLPFTWGGFALAVTTGSVMIFANPIGYAANTWFRVKFALLATAGLNMLLFHFVSAKQLEQPAAIAPRVSGGLSLVVWTGVIIAGRWIGYTI